jgi:hypothetical protein
MGYTTIMNLVHKQIQSNLDSELYYIVKNKINQDILLDVMDFKLQCSDVIDEQIIDIIYKRLL